MVRHSDVEPILSCRLIVGIDVQATAEVIEKVETRI